MISLTNPKKFNVRNQMQNSSILKSYLDVEISFADPHLKKPDLDPTFSKLLRKNRVDNAFKAGMRIRFC